LVGARSAGRALGQLLDYKVEIGLPRVCGPEDLDALGRWSTSIVFDVEGDLNGLVAIVLGEPVRGFAIEKLVGRSHPDGRVAESALQELGNILASQTVSAIADSLGARIMLSVPTLAMQGAGERLATQLRERGTGIHVAIDLADPDGEQPALLIIGPYMKLGGEL
jgi:chemotaxis protein CheC